MLALVYVNEVHFHEINSFKDRFNFGPIFFLCKESVKRQSIHEFIVSLRWSHSHWIQTLHGLIK